MKISFIVTVLNEFGNIEKLLDSLLDQTKLPDEVIVVDANSTDGTKLKILNYKLNFKKKGIKFKLIIKNGNRSVGRNEAINNSEGDIIACTDAGCILDNDWLINITSPFKSTEIDVIAGNAKGTSENAFQKCLLPYILVMQDKIKPEKFLPATRSMAFRKSIWEKIGGFDEKLSNNEDYVFARKLKKINAIIKFQRNAVVYWIPKKGIMNAFVTFYRFAKGDSEAGIMRPKVLFMIFRYLIGLLLLSLAIIYMHRLLMTVIVVLIILYFTWSIIKNYKYVNNLKAVIYLPMLQIISDIAILCGTFAGLYKIWGTKKTQ